MPFPTRWLMILKNNPQLGVIILGQRGQLVSLYFCEKLQTSGGEHVYVKTVDQINMRRNQRALVINKPSQMDWYLWYQHLILMSSMPSNTNSFIPRIDIFFVLKFNILFLSWWTNYVSGNQCAVVLKQWPRLHTLPLACVNTNFNFDLK